ncbi:MAG TPA: mRNA surveillance protein pelota [Candidatus Thermoplasmatota archaeon]|nr:mRNA surveillance protein pelota [Candidatus Thermoplasmatota archaeon]
MKVVHVDRVEGTARLRVETLDDLWHLSELILPGDRVNALTWRTAELDTKGAERQGKAEKRAMTLTVHVESVEWDAFSNRLRVLGPIVEGPQDVGSYHTIVIEPLTELTIRKMHGLKPHHLQRIEEAVTAAMRPQVVFLAIEENEAVVALLRQYGVQKMADIVGHVSGKQYASSARGDEESFFDEVLMALRDYRPDGAPLLVLGPGFAKERFMAFARQKQPALVKGAAIEATGQAGMTGIHEAIKRGSVERVAKDSRVSLETALVERFLEALGKGDPVAYGAADVARTTQQGAADVVLVTDTLVREGEGERFLDLARDTGAQAHIISTHHEAGARFQKLGGIAAILRYRVE